MSDEKEDKRTWDEQVMDSLKDAQDTRCIVFGITYDNVMKLQKILRKKGIDCNVVVGGFAIYANYKDKRVIKACKKFKTVAHPGVSRFVEDACLRKIPFPTIENPNPE